MRKGFLDGSSWVGWMWDEHVQKWYTHWERDSQHNISYFPNRRFKSLVKYQVGCVIIPAHSCRPFRINSNKLLRIHILQKKHWKKTKISLVDKATNLTFFFLTLWGIITAKQHLWVLTHLRVHMRTCTTALLLAPLGNNTSTQEVLHFY